MSAIFSGEAISFSLLIITHLDFVILAVFFLILRLYACNNVCFVLQRLEVSDGMFVYMKDIVKHLTLALKTSSEHGVLIENSLNNVCGSGILHI